MCVCVSVVLNNPVYCLQTELRRLAGALSDRKCEILQKMAGILDRPAQQQQEVKNPRKHTCTNTHAHIHTQKDMQNDKYTYSEQDKWMNVHTVC